MRKINGISEYIWLKNQIVALAKTKQETGEELNFRQIASKFHLTYSQIEDICGSVDNININVAVGIQGFGTAELPKGQWTVEILD